MIRVIKSPKFAKPRHDQVNPGSSNFIKSSSGPPSSRSGSYTYGMTPRGVPEGYFPSKDSSEPMDNRRLGAGRAASSSEANL